MHMDGCIYVQCYFFTVVGIKPTHPLMTNALFRGTSFPPKAARAEEWLIKCPACTIR